MSRSWLTRDFVTSRNPSDLEAFSRNIMEEIAGQTRATRCLGPASLVSTRGLGSARRAPRNGAGRLDMSAKCVRSGCAHGLSAIESRHGNRRGNAAFSPGPHLLGISARPRGQTGLRAIAGSELRSPTGGGHRTPRHRASPGIGAQGRALRDCPVGAIEAPLRNMTGGGGL